MKKYFYPVYFFLLIAGNKINAQCTLNYLLNPSFEVPVQPNNNGNNIITGISSYGNWVITNPVPATLNPWNIVRVNGSGYTGGPNNAQQGSQYADVNSSAGNIEQAFNLGCNATITYSGYFSSREAAGYTDWTARIDILNSVGVVVSTSTTRLFTVADADNNPGDAVWYQLTGSAALTAGAYTYRAVLGNYGNFDNAFLCAAPGCLLPVKLTSFDAEVKNCITKLTWSAESETDFDKYIIEYSQNGIDFIPVGFVNSAAQGSARDYSFQHTGVAGKGIYRLKMKDIDGKETYSKIIALNINCNNSTILIYPNPVSDVLYVNIVSSSIQNNPTAFLYDANGQLVLKKHLRNGTNSIAMKEMSSGIYNLVVVNGNERTSHKIMR